VWLQDSAKAMSFSTLSKFSEEAVWQPFGCLEQMVTGDPKLPAHLPKLLHDIADLLSGVTQEVKTSSRGILNPGSFEMQIEPSGKRR
jgi:hypothetical protein